MVRLLKLVVAGAFCATSFIGCGLIDPSDGASVDFNDVTVNGPVTAGGGAVKITGTLDGSAEISSVVFMVTTSSNAVTNGFTVSYDDVKKKTLNLESDLNAKITAASSVTAGSYKLKITATVDGTEFEQSVSFTVSTGTSATVLTEKTNGIISNIWGPDQGAFNLADGTRVLLTTASTTKDLLDLSVVTEGFKGELGSANGSMFATVDAGDYTNATDISVKALAANASANKVTVSTVGTVFVVKLGGSRGYAIVKITSYDATAGESTGDNTGEVKFSYKFTN